jgi:hypothetical protein
MHYLFGNKKVELFLTQKKYTLLKRSTVKHENKDPPFMYKIMSMGVMVRNVWKIVFDGCSIDSN